MIKEKKQWLKYCEEQLSRVTPLLINEGFELCAEQPHLKGERYILSGPKMVLYGKRKSDGLKVVIKITNNPKLTNELNKEILLSEQIKSLRFAYKTFLFPREILSGHKSQYTFLITEYIEQDKPFLKISTKEQFSIALKSFETQEGFHATAHNHLNSIRNIFEIYDSKKYIKNIKLIINNIDKNKQTSEVLTKVLELFKKNKKNIDLYSNFLIHWDFVPHNIRINKRKIYFLDHTAIRFGNKYEGWARFMNFMLLYNNELEKMLDRYVKENRLQNEYKSLYLMRIYRLTELISFYSTKIKYTDGKLFKLTNARINFWTRVLEAFLNKKPIDEDIINKYKKTRDNLRDEDEKERQKKLY